MKEEHNHLPPKLTWNTLKILHLINRDEKVTLSEGISNEYIIWLIKEGLLKYDGKQIHGIELEQEEKDFYSVYKKRYFPLFQKWAKLLIKLGVYDLSQNINQDMIEEITELYQKRLNGFIITAEEGFKEYRKEYGEPNEVMLSLIKCLDACGLDETEDELEQLTFQLLDQNPELEYLKLNSCRAYYLGSDFLLMIGWGSEQFEEFDLFEDLQHLNFKTRTISGYVSRKYISENWRSNEDILTV